MKYISFKIDEAIEMLMDNMAIKGEVASFLMDFKKILNNPEKEIIDSSFREIDAKKNADGRFVE